MDRLHNGKGLTIGRLKSVRLNFAYHCTCTLARSLSDIVLNTEQRVGNLEIRFAIRLVKRSFSERLAEIEICDAKSQPTKELLNENHLLLPTASTF